MKDIPSIVDNLDKIIDKVMTRITSHPRTNPDKLNFFEWLFLRRFCVAWNMAAGKD